MAHDISRKQKCCAQPTKDQYRHQPPLSLLHAARQIAFVTSFITDFSNRMKDGRLSVRLSKLLLCYQRCISFIVKAQEHILCPILLYSLLNRAINSPAVYCIAPLQATELISQLEVNRRTERREEVGTNRGQFVQFASNSRKNNCISN